MNIISADINIISIICLYRGLMTRDVDSLSGKFDWGGAVGHLLDAGPENLSDLEMLELAVGTAVASGLAGRVTQDLLHEFGSFSRVVYGQPARLMAVEGVTPALLKNLRLLRVCAQRLARAEIEDRPIISKWSELVEYMRTSIGHGVVEALHVLYLDHAHRLIKDEIPQRGVTNHTPVYPAQIAGRALEVGASAVIIAHNHTVDDCTPSPADIDITIKVVGALASLNITLHDHIIINKCSHYSFRSSGLL